ncbi:MAG TPA: class A beta-lactamase-related serine hydrolase [Cyclobacteriaceae bacterium]|nr:class A beta-lactamase-related serine hydrolase [Cyclobacteriaceae bacterium]
MRVILMCAILILMMACKQENKLATLQEQIANELNTQEGVFAVAFKDLQSGEELLMNASEVFHAASTMKTPVMIEVYKQAAEGRWSLSDSIEVKNVFSSIVDGSAYSLNADDDSEKELYTKVGQKATLYDLTYDMIIMSSNLATNIVIEYVDAKKVTQTMRGMGAKDIQVLRGVEDGKAYQQGLNNTTTAYDLMLIFEQLASGKAVNAAASEAMIDILLDQKFKDMIPAQLPAEVKVAHKTGSITGVRHDSGIVFLPDGRKYVLVLLSKQMPQPKEGVAAMANVSKMIYDYMLSNK